VVGQITEFKIVEASKWLHSAPFGLWVQGSISCDVLSRHVCCGMVNGLDAEGDLNEFAPVVTGVSVVTYPRQIQNRLTVTGGIQPLQRTTRNLADALISALGESV
jgi:hypothetical protein